MLRWPADGWLADRIWLGMTGRSVHDDSGNLNLE
jgi:hypothetical protein